MAQKTWVCDKSTVRIQGSGETKQRDGGGEQHFLAGSASGYAYTTLCHFAVNWDGVKQIQSAYLVLTSTPNQQHAGWPQNSYDSGINIARMTSSFSDPNNAMAEGQFSAAPGSYAVEGRDSTHHPTNAHIKPGNGVVNRINITSLVNDMAPKSVKTSGGLTPPALPHYGFLIRRRTTSTRPNPRMAVASDRYPDTTIRPYIELNYIPIQSPNTVTPTNPTGSISDVLGENFEATFNRGANQPTDVKPAKWGIELYLTGGTTPVWSYEAGATPSDVIEMTCTVPLSAVGTTGSKYKLVSGQG